MREDARRLAAVVLAAGASSRLGSAKQLVEFRGEPLVRRAARAAIEAGAAPVIVVLGARAEEVESAVAGMTGVTAVVNDEWADGLASSLARGVRAAMQVDATSDGVLIVAADQPMVDGDALRYLVCAFGEGARLVAATYAGTIGVPAVIGREHFASLLDLTGDAGAGRWLRGRAGEVRRVPMPGADLDIDDAADLAALRAQ